MIILKRREHDVSEACWCRPSVLPCDGGEIVVHGDEIGALLGLDAVLLAEGKP